MGSATAFRLIPGFLVGVYRIYLQVFWFPSTVKNIHIGLSLNLPGGSISAEPTANVSQNLQLHVQKTVHITKTSVPFHSICT